ncbi:uncharacterized protein ARMOST_14546 [Armillaria ostoyae]|uniref:F-box domain-containing protein n=1 Tax=Armillaria ostoyae TaxID=47428 RepID=A0A284RQX9_ARMOS|nr:uncharacterized protein ARMOST_14546 [Armillaria ostoyae]
MLPGDTFYTFGSSYLDGASADVVHRGQGMQAPANLVYERNLNTDVDELVSVTEFGMGTLMLSICSTQRVKTPKVLFRSSNYLYIPFSKQIALIPQVHQNTTILACMMQSTLEDIVVRHGWISTFAHPSDVLALLRTNDAPSPLQSARLKASFEGLQTALAELQSNLDLLHNVAASLQTQMSCLLSLKHDYETALSPIRRIPPEITTEILCRSSKDIVVSDISLGRRISGFNVFTVGDGPWYLGQVCSSWRHVVETLCPELWASMTVEIPFLYNRKRPVKADRMEILRVILERSRNHPLDFYFEHYGLRAVEEETMDQCFDIMVSQSKRWRAVEMKLGPSVLPRLSLIRGKINWLREAYIYCPDDRLPSGDINAFEVAPKLEKLHLKGMHPEANIHFPVTNLVSFSDERPFSGDRLTLEYLDVITSAPKLRSFSYNDYGHSFIFTPFPTPRVMSRSLEELSASSPSFMRSMILPSLKKALLSTTNDIDMDEEEVVTVNCPEGALGALHDMLLQSHCFLTRLHLIDVVLNDNFANIIHLIPRLQEFVVEFYEWVAAYNTVMKSLVTQLSEVSLVDGSLQHSAVPSLQKLGVYLHDLLGAHVSFIDSAFVDMIASRVRRPLDAPCLTELGLWVVGTGWTYGLDKEDENVLNSLEGEGLDLDFSLDNEDSESD